MLDMVNTRRSILFILVTLFSLVKFHKIALKYNLFVVFSKVFACCITCLQNFIQALLN